MLRIGQIAYKLPALKIEYIKDPEWIEGRSTLFFA
jgi:hypothetical protein